MFDMGREKTKKVKSPARGGVSDMTQPQSQEHLVRETTSLYVECMVALGNDNISVSPPLRKSESSFGYPLQKGFSLRGTFFFRRRREGAARDTRRQSRASPSK
jgi:hypothetical protein